MKKLIGLAMGAAVLYKVAKDKGIRSFKDLKTLLTSELKNISNGVKEELVA